MKAAKYRASKFKKNKKLAASITKARESFAAIQKSRADKLEKLQAKWNSKFSKSKMRHIELYRPALTKKILEIPDSETMFKNYLEERKEFLAALKAKQTAYRSELMSQIETQREFKATERSDRIKSEQLAEMKLQAQERAEKEKHLDMKKQESENLRKDLAQQISERVIHDEDSYL